jgi:hypothetical protein
MSTSSTKQTVPEVLLKWLEHETPYHKAYRARQLKRGRYGRLLIRSRLGQLLYDAARLFEVMDNFRDRRLIDEYLVENPPLHARRTLDQAYYWSLKHTSARDRDQVVYRETSARPNNLHHYDPDKEAWNCDRHDFRAVRDEEDEEAVLDEKATNATAGPPNVLRRLLSTVTEVSENSTQPPDLASHRSSQPDLESCPSSVTGTNSSARQQQEQQCRLGHGRQRHKGCEGCREAMQKFPRLIMVDQLWMWILDDETIITCFPKRYGVNRKDASGVHKSIRVRLEGLGKSEIHSAYDLGLLIMDECCKVFHKARNDRRQPQIINIFSEAIGKMVSKAPEPLLSPLEM